MVINNSTFKNVNRVLSVEVEENEIDIDFTVKNSIYEVTKTINLSRREALSLTYFLIKYLLPWKILVNNKHLNNKV